MDFFERRDGVLHGDGADLRAVAQTHGTPLYVYSAATVERHVSVMRDAMGSLPHLICYAVKANANLALLEVLARAGCGFDAVSVGELARVWKATGDLANTIVSGVGKRDDEIDAALRANARYLCIESEDELAAIERIAALRKVRARVTVRVNPDVDAKTHPHISTGLRENKFGVPSDRARALYAVGNASPHLEMVGLSCHIGSQIIAMEPFLDAAKLVAELARELIADRTPLTHIGMGGGLGIPYGDETPPPPADYGAALRKILTPLGLTLVLEPGRVIVGNAGVLLTRVLRIKRHGEKLFAIVDAGMNDLLRPALYSATHEIVPVEANAGGETEEYEVVGPVCESADTFARGKRLPRLEEGSLLALRSAGAYGFVMSSTYNGRPKVAEVLCSQGQDLLIRERESLSDLWRGEISLNGVPFDSALPSFLEDE